MHTVILKIYENHEWTKMKIFFYNGAIKSGRWHGRPPTT